MKNTKKMMFDSLASAIAMLLAVLFTVFGKADVGTVLMLVAIWCVLPHERHEP